MIDDKIQKFLDDAFKVLQKARSPIDQGDLLKGIVGYLESRGISNSYSRRLGVFVCNMAEKTKKASLIRRVNPNSLEVISENFIPLKLNYLTRKCLDELRDPEDSDHSGLYGQLRNYILTR
ncbi:hypothetical protein HYX16_00765 [Candidatus Woesearchaeota archaeon]|nr:hypothetical protein [Candidatus Woesearchaeota archaeon]